MIIEKWQHFKKKIVKNALKLEEFSTYRKILRTSVDNFVLQMQSKLQADRITFFRVIKFEKT